MVKLKTDNLKKNPFDEAETQNRGKSVWDLAEETPDYGRVALPKERLPGVWDYDKQLDQLLGDPEIDIEKLMPLDVRYDFGKIVGMTEKPDETKDKMATSLFYSVELGIPPSVSFSILDELNKIAFDKSIPPSNAWGRIKQRYRTGKAEVQLMDMGFDILKGTWQDWEKYDRSVKNIEKLQSGMTVDQRKEFRNFFEKLVGASAELAPFGLEAAKEMPLGAGIGGTLFGIGAALATAAIPTVGEEVPAVTAAVLTGMKLGAGVRGAIRVGQLEAGGMFLELANMKDQYGNRIDPRIAVVASHAVGAINGGIELAEWHILASTFGIGKKLFDKSVRKVTHRLLTQGTLKELIARKALDYSIALGAETLQEIEQETTNVIFGELAKELNDAREGTDFTPISGEDLKARYQEVTVESMRAFGLMVLPGTTVSGALELVAQKKAEAAKKAEKPGVVEVKAPPTEAIPAPEQAIQPQKPAEVAEIPPVTPTIAEAEPAKAKPIVKEEVSPIVEPELTKQEKSDIARLEAEIEEPFEMVRVKGVGFVIKEKATGKEAVTIAKRKEAKARLAEYNQGEREIRETRRKPKLLTGKATIGKLITEAQALKAAMKKAAQSARKAYREGKTEGIAKVKAYYYDIKQREQVRKQFKKRITKAVKTITKDISKSVDFKYREAIENLQAGIDPQFRTKKTLEMRERTREFLARKPEALRDMPVKLLKKLQKKSIGEYTIEEIEKVAEEIERLIKQGKLKRKLRLAQRERKLGKTTQELTETISKGEKVEFESEPVTYETTKEGLVKTAYVKGRAWTLRPSRIFDMLDGGKATFSGKAHRIFIDQVNNATNAKLRMVDKRKDAGIAKMKELGITSRDLSQVRTIDGVRYMVDEMIGIYCANKNQLAKLALMYGNNLNEKAIGNVIANLTENEKAWGDFIISEYETRYDVLREKIIEVENRDMGYEENYTPIRRTEVDYSTHTEEIIDAILQKEHLRRAYAEHGFTIHRKEVPAEFQKPIRLNVTGVWASQISKQEQYIHLAELVRDLHKIVGDRDFRVAVEQQFGKEFNRIIKNYVDRVANPNIYKSYSSLENMSRRLRQNAVIAYLGYNLVTMAKQVPSMFLYLQDAGPTHLVSSAMEFVRHPLKMVDMVREKDPQVKHRAIERELEEMKLRNPEMYNNMLAKFGKAGMEGIYLFDTVARTIGWNAVYQKALKSDKSEAESVRLAQNATLRTQPAAAAKDVAQLYATNEFANWFTMFTNQLNQIYQIATYDMSGYVKNAEYQKAALAFTGLSLTALFIWIITKRRLPESKEDWVDVAAEQFINAVPLVGKAIMVGKKGWGDVAPPVFDLPQAGGRALDKIASGKFNEKDMAAIAEGIAVVVGIPYTGPKRVIKMVKTGEIKELIGGEPIEKKGRKPKKITRSL